MPGLHDQLELFFQPLVGTPEAEHKFHTKLGQAALRAQIEGSDPYLAISKAWMNESFAAVQASHPAMRTPKEIANTQVIIGNKDIGPSMLLVTLRALGYIYKTDATAPQYKSTVEESVGAAVSHIYDLAFIGDQAKANVYKDAFALGAPQGGPELRRRMELFIGQQLPILGDPEYMRDSFTSAVNEATGQLLVTPAYPWPARDPRRFCPAAAVQVSRTEQDVSALMTTLETISAAVVEQVYPKQFAMVMDH